MTPPKRNPPRGVPDEHEFVLAMARHGLAGTAEHFDLEYDHVVARAQALGLLSVPQLGLPTMQSLVRDGHITEQEAGTICRETWHDDYRNYESRTKQALATDAERLRRSTLDQEADSILDGESGYAPELYWRETLRSLRSLEITIRVLREQLQPALKTDDQGRDPDGTPVAFSYGTRPREQLMGIIAENIDDCERMASLARRALARGWMHAGTNYLLSAWGQLDLSNHLAVKVAIHDREFAPRRTRSTGAKGAADARHAENKQAKPRTVKWFIDEHLRSGISVNKAASDLHRDADLRVRVTGTERRYSTETYRSWFKNAKK